MNDQFSEENIKSEVNPNNLFKKLSNAVKAVNDENNTENV